MRDESTAAYLVSCRSHIHLHVLQLRKDPHRAQHSQSCATQWSWPSDLVRKRQCTAQTDLLQELRIYHPRSVRNDLVHPSAVTYCFAPCIENKTQRLNRSTAPVSAHLSAWVITVLFLCASHCSSELTPASKYTPGVQSPSLAVASGCPGGVTSGKASFACLNCNAWPKWNRSYTPTEVCQ